MTDPRIPTYPNDADYNTNAPSYYDDLARKQKLLQILSDRIWEYDKTLNSSLENIQKVLDNYIAILDGKFAGFDQSVMNLLTEWIQDGTFANIINNEIFNMKADTSYVNDKFMKSDLQMLQNALEINTLNTKLSGIDNGYKGTYATLAELTAAFPTGNVHRYGVTATAKWYYWKDAWLVGGSLDSASLTERTMEGRRGKNLYNKKKITRSYYVGANGNLVFNGLYNTSEFIEIDPTKQLYTNELFAGAYYDQNKVFISMFSTKLFTPPATAKFIRLTVLEGKEEITQIEYGNEATRYENYYLLDNSQLFPIEKNSLAFDVVHSFPSKNLFNPALLIPQRYMTDDGQSVYSNQGYNLSGYQKVSPNTVYSLNRVYWANIHFFDRNFVRITGIKPDKDSFTTPENCAFIMFTVQDPFIGKIQLEKNAKSTAYETYGNKIRSTDVSGLQINADPNKRKVIFVLKAGGDYSTVHAANNSITDNSENNPYTIVIGEGIFLEGNIRSKPYVNYIGLDKYKTILRYAGDVAKWNDTSTFFLESESIVENMTIEATDTKYPVHVDKQTGKWKSGLKNVRMIHKGSATDPLKAGTPLGVGLFEGQHLDVKRCELVDTSGAFGSSGIFFHNASDMAGTGYRSISIEENLIKGVTYGIRPNAVNGTTNVQNNDAYIINNDITASHQEYYFAEEATDTSWHLFKKGNTFKQGK